MQKPKYFYIHGFATNLTHTFQPKQFTISQLFPALLRNASLDDFKAFLWGIDLHLNWWQMANVSHYTKLYEAEKKLASHQETFQKLDFSLQEAEPTVIFAHSMGTFLLLNYLDNFDLPASVQKIIFLQADIDFKRELPKSLKNKIADQKVQMINYYCFWDDSLTVSSALNKKLRAGVFGWRQKGVQNRFFALGAERGFLHNSVLESKRLSKKLKKDI